MPAASVFAQVPAARPPSYGGKAAEHKVRRSYFFGFGPGYFSNLNSRAMATAFSLGISWDIDPALDLYLTTDFAFSFKHNDVRYFVPMMKLRYMFAEEEANHSAFAGGGIGLGYARNHDTFGFPPDSVTGFSLNLGIGYKFYRKTTMPIVLELEHQMILQESHYGTPIMTWVKIGAFFP
jgi:hypothetical protein